MISMISDTDPRFNPYYDHDVRKVLPRLNYHWVIQNPLGTLPTPTRKPLPTTINNSIDEDAISMVSMISHNNPLESFNNSTVQPQNDAQGTTDNVTDSTINQNSDLSLEDEVHELVTGTSQKFVPQPTLDNVISDAIQGLKRFRITVRLKEEIRNRKIQQHNNSTDNLHIDNSDSTSKASLNSDISERTPEGLKTNLHPPGRGGSKTTCGSEPVELFLKDLEKEVLHMVWQYRNHKTVHPMSTQIRQIQTRLRNTDDSVVIPTDKTNSFRTIPITTYIEQVHTHLQNHGK